MSTRTAFESELRRYADILLTLTDEIAVTPEKVALVTLRPNRRKPPLRGRFDPSFHGLDCDLYSSVGMPPQ